MKNKYKIALLALSICLSVAFLFGTSYALWTDTKTQTDENKIVAGCFSIEFEDSNLISLGNTYPMTDAEGLATTPYTMTVKNTCNIAAKMQIVMNVMNTTTMPAEKVALQVSGAKAINKTLVNTLTEVEPVGTKAAQATTAYEITTDILKPEETKTYEFRIWIDEVAEEEVEGQTFESNIVIHSAATKIKEQYADACNANIPELSNGLIPVLYQDGKWVKADTEQKWFDYCNQEWANAVTVKEANRSTYTSAIAGTEIPMEDINTMWVWIPRYEYQTDNLTYIQDNTLHNQYAGGTQAQPGAININFVSKETTTASADNYIIHPAFTFGTQQLSGMWVAKFEMSPQAGTTCATTANETNCDITTFAPEIKPSAPSWRIVRVGTFFTAIQKQMNGSKGTTTYGLSNNDTHMMKNMEWGAVAYLSQSKYGKYGNTTYTGADKEVAKNNCSTYITGIGGDTVSASYTPATCTTNTYETEKGQAASTTGNIYGIYDMNGGAAEYVMGVMKESTNSEVSVGFNSVKSNSGFSGKLYNGTDYTGTYGNLKDIDAKYYDVYDYGATKNDAAAYKRGHQGDGTKEVVGWYQDRANFMGDNNSWFVRGGDYYEGISTGVFSFYDYVGCIFNFSARAVLVSAES